MLAINVSISNPMVANMPACLLHGGIEAFIELTAEMVNQSRVEVYLLLELIYFSNSHF